MLDILVLDILSIGILTLTVAGFMRAPWWFTIIDFFRLQYICVSFFLLCLYFFYPSSVILGANFLSIVLNIYRMHLFLPRFRSGGIYQRKTLLSVNAYKNNKSPEKLAKIIAEADPAVLLVLEMTESTEKALGPILKSYPYAMQTPVRDGFYIALYSRSPLENRKIHEFGPDGTPLLTADVNINGNEYKVFSAHPKPSLSRDWHIQRQAYFQSVIPVIQKTERSVIVMGDFNSVPWGYGFKQFLSEAGLKSTLEGQGYKITWPAFFFLAGVPMDHILISRDMSYSNLNTGPYVGSDHYPISVNI